MDKQALQVILYSLDLFYTSNGTNKSIMDVDNDDIDDRINDIPTEDDIEIGNSKFEELLVKPELQSNVFLWLLYCIFKALSKCSPVPYFEQAFTFIHDPIHRKFLHTEYFRWQVSQEYPKKHLLGYVEKLFHEFGATIDSPMLDELLPPVQENSDICNFILPPTVDNYSFFDEIIDILLTYLKKEGQESILEFYLQRFPRNVSLHFRCAELYVKKEKFNKARRAYCAAIKLCPTFDICWERLLDLEILTSNNENEIRALFLAATSHIPEHESLRAKELEFEKSLAKKPMTPGTKAIGTKKN